MLWLRATAGSLFSWRAAGSLQRFMDVYALPDLFFSWQACPCMPPPPAMDVYLYRSEVSDGGGVSTMCAWCRSIPNTEKTRARRRRQTRGSNPAPRRAISIFCRSSGSASSLWKPSSPCLPASPSPSHGFPRKKTTTARRQPSKYKYRECTENARVFMYVAGDGWRGPRASHGHQAGQRGGRERPARRGRVEQDAHADGDLQATVPPASRHLSLSRRAPAGSVRWGRTAQAARTRTPWRSPATPPAAEIFGYGCAQHPQDQGAGHAEAPPGPGRRVRR